MARLLLQYKASPNGAVAISVPDSWNLVCDGLKDRESISRIPVRLLVVNTVKRIIVSFPQRTSRSRLLAEYLRLSWWQLEDTVVFSCTILSTQSIMICKFSLGYGSFLCEKLVLQWAALNMYVSSQLMGQFGYRKAFIVRLLPIVLATLFQGKPPYWLVTPKTSTFPS